MKLLIDFISNVYKSLIKFLTFSIVSFKGEVIYGIITSNNLDVLFRKLNYHKRVETEDRIIGFCIMNCYIDSKIYYDVIKQKRKTHEYSSPRSTKNLSNSIP